MDGLIQWGLPIVQWVQTLRNPILDSLMGITYYLGAQDFFILLLPLILWCIDKSLGIRLSAALIFSNYVNLFFKDLFVAKRPYQVDDRLYAPFKTEGYGIPSGHSQSTVTFWGYIATQMKKSGWWTIAVIVSLWIGIGRMYVGDHFPQDVLLGWILGIVVVVATALLQSPISAWLGKQSLVIQIGLGIIAPIILFTLHATSDTAKMMGILVGLFALLPIEEKFAGFNEHTTLPKQIVKFVMGATVVLALRFGLKAIFPDQMIFDFIRYALMGAWTIFGAPWVFVQTGLAARNLRPMNS